MPSPLSSTSRAALLTLVALAVLAGCGTGERAAADPRPSPSSSAPPASAAPPSGIATPGDLRSTTTSSQAPVPSGGPTEVGDFPVPPGVRVKAPAPQSRSWQFDITTGDTEKVLAFYRTALAAQGYRVQNDVTVKVGDETVRYDIRFSGPAEGYLVADPGEDNVFVVVQSLPNRE